MAERLRRLTRNQLGSPRAGSSPADCDTGTSNPFTTQKKEVFTTLLLTCFFSPAEVLSPPSLLQRAQYHWAMRPLGHFSAIAASTTMMLSCQCASPPSRPGHVPYRRLRGPGIAGLQLVAPQLAACCSVRLSLSR